MGPIWSNLAGMCVEMTPKCSGLQCLSTFGRVSDRLSDGQCGCWITNLRRPVSHWVRARGQLRGLSTEKRTRRGSAKISPVAASQSPDVDKNLRHHEADPYFAVLGGSGFPLSPHHKSVRPQPAVVLGAPPLLTSGLFLPTGLVDLLRILYRALSSQRMPK